MPNEMHIPVFEDKSLYIESMDLDAKGIGHKEDGKVVFVDGALPFERVRPNVHRKKDNWRWPRYKRSTKNPTPESSRLAHMRATTQVLVADAKCSI